MSSQQNQNALNRIVNIFLDMATRQISQLELNIQNEQQQDSCFEFQESTKQYEDFDNFEEREEPILKDNQQQNIIKNVLKSFRSYLAKLQDSTTIKKYQQMNFKETNKPFSEIIKAVSKKVNIKANRWNFQLRSLLQSQSLKLIFYDYLANHSQLWLQKSKVSNLDEHQRFIDVLLNWIGNNQPLDIKYFRKRNDTLKSYMLNYQFLSQKLQLSKTSFSTI